MKKHSLIDTFVYGLVLWVIGFALGMALFPFVDVSIMGWFIMPVVLIVALILAVRMRRRRSAAPVSYFIGVGVVWVMVSLILDYLILVQAYNAEGFYDTDIVIYYVGMFLIPIVVSVIPIKE